jgi:hypothetical protein
MDKQKGWARNIGEGREGHKGRGNHLNVMEREREMMMEQTNKRDRITIWKKGRKKKGRKEIKI